jgi:endonuclease/exonuclease/phosphatase family metal-dependent hydrolase
MTRRAAGAATVFVAALGLGCAHATNYLDRAGPVYRHAREEPARGLDAFTGGDPALLRVVSFNIAYGIEIDRAIEVLQQTESLRSPDLLALQEMDAPGTERIARALGLNSVYFPSGVHPKHRRDFGCALLSPWTLEEPRKVLLPHGARGSGLRRAAAAATLVRRGRRIHVYSVHLPSPMAISGGSRREQLRVLAADAATAAGPVVIAGDFNSHDKVQELANAGFRWLTRDLGPTTGIRLLGLDLGGLSYDHVLVRGFRLSSGAGAMGVVADKRGASDHKPIWVVLLADDGPAGAPAPRAGGRAALR